MDTAFISPVLLPSCAGRARPNVCQRSTLCAATSPASSGTSDLIGPRRRPLEHTNSAAAADSAAERDVAESLRPSPGELLDAQAYQLRRTASQKRARAISDAQSIPAEAKTAVLEEDTTKPLVTTTAFKDDEKISGLADLSNISKLSGLSEEDVTSQWVRKGNSNRVRRTAEIWWFFFKMVTGELKIRKMEDAAEQSAARTLHAQKLKKGLLTLGPTFIKFGQLMSTRVDIVAKEYIAELQSLQDRVPCFSAQKAVDVIESEFKRPIEEIYEKFDPIPLAAASLGQVHRAVFRGRQVAVKIQRAGLQELFDMDLKNFRSLAALLDKFDPKNDGANRNWVSIFEESAKLLYEEINYMQEGRNAELFRNNFKNTPWVKVPKVFWDATTSRVLTMEYVPGIKINDYEALEKAGIDRQLLATRSAESYLTQLLRHGYFHTDPHCGNLAVDAVEGGRLIYYDFGMMSRFEPNIKRGLVDVIFGIYEGSAREVCDAMEKMGVLAKGADRITVEKVGRYFLSLFRTNLDGGNRKKNASEKKTEMKNRLGTIGEDLLAVSEDECFNFPPVFTFVFRAFTTLEGIGKGLYPKYDLTITAGPYLKELIDLKDGSATKTALKSFRKKVGWRNQDIAALVQQPRKTQYIENTLRRMESGDLRMRVRVLESERAFKKMNIMQQNLSLTLVAATFANMAVVLSTAGQKFAIQAKLVWLLAIIVTIKLIAGILKYRAVEKRLRKYTKA